MDVMRINDLVLWADFCEAIRENDRAWIEAVLLGTARGCKGREECAAIIEEGPVGARKFLRDWGLHTACQYADVETIRLLLRYFHGDINKQNLYSDLSDDLYFTPLHIAAICGRKDVVELLLSAGADPFLLTLQKMTAQDLAAQHDKLEVVAYLEAHSAACSDAEKMKNRANYRLQRLKPQERLRQKLLREEDRRINSK